MKTLMTWIILTTFGSTNIFQYALADRVDDAKALAKGTHEKARLIGKDLANEQFGDLLQDQFKAKKDLDAHLASYAAIISAEFNKLKSDIVSTDSQFSDTSMSDQKLKDLYEALKKEIRLRFEMSWAPTNIDNESRILLDNFKNLSARMEQSCSASIIRTAGLLPPLELEKVYVPHDCQYEFRIPTVTANDGNSSQQGQVQQKPSSDSQDWGDMKLMCYGPNGSVPLVDAANYAGATAVVSGAAYAGFTLLAHGALAATGASIAATVGAASLGVGVVLAAVAMSIIAGQVDEEMRSLIYSNEIKLTQSATASDIVLSYQNQCLQNLVELKKMDSNLDDYLSSDPEKHARALTEHADVAKKVNQITKNQIKMADAVCRENLRQAEKTSNNQCSIDPKNDGKQASLDKEALKSQVETFATQNTLELLKYGIIEGDLHVTDSGLRGDTGPYWQQMDEAIDLAYAHFLKLLKIRNAKFLTTQDRNFKAIETELAQTADWLKLRKEYLVLMGDAVDAIFGQFDKKKLAAEIRFFEKELSIFAISHPSIHDEVGSFQTSLIEVRQLAL